MSDLNVRRTNSDSDQQLKRVLPTRLSLGSGILCISLLAGCASAPDQPQPIDPETSTPTMQEAPSVVTPQETKASVVAPVTENTVEQPSTPEDSGVKDSTTEDSVEQTATTTADENSAVESGEEATQSPTGVLVASQADNSDVTVSSAEIRSTTGDTIDDTIDDTIGDRTGDTTDNTSAQAVSEAAPEATLTAALVAASEVEETTATTQSESLTPRSKNNMGKSYGIWTLKPSGNGYCKLSTPTLQTGNKEYSSQIWMDIEEQRVVVNAFMSLDIAHPKSGIQIDNQPLIPFSEKVYSTRAVVVGDLTTQLAEGNQLHVYINGQEVGKQVLRRDVTLTQMNTAIAALKSCGE